MLKLLLFTCLCFAAKAIEPLPWLTGPLIAPVGTAIPYGHFLLKSYFSLDMQKCKAPWNSSKHDLYSLSYQGFYFFGLTSYCDLNIVPRIFYKTSSGQHSFDMGNLTVGLDVQLLADDYTIYFPGIKFAVKENFPTGNFQYLHPRKLTTDQTGFGTFSTEFALVFYKLFHLRKSCWLSTTLSGEYTVKAPVHVHGFNAYGGGFGTKGVALPGNLFRTILSFELALSRNLALALDNVFSYVESSQFLGMEGIAFDGTDALVGAPFSRQLSFAPAIEVNFSKAFGIIAGYYFSALSKHVEEFHQFIVNFNYLY